MKPRVPLPGPVKRMLRKSYEDWRVHRFEDRARPLANRSRPHKRALILPAAGPGSLGDEAMLMASGQVMRRHGIERLTVLSYGAGDPWSPTGEIDDIIDLGTRYSTAFWKSCELVLEALTTSTHLLIQGADIMDGYYSPYESFRRATYARMAAAAGLQTTIGGFSFNATPHPRSVASLAALPSAVRLVARDPVSWRRLTALIERPVHAGADMAFLLKPAPSNAVIESHCSWTDSQRTDGRLVLGVNANYLVAPGRESSDAGQVLADAYASGLAPLLTDAAPVSLLLIPHDHRAMAGRYTDLELLDAVAAKLPGESDTHVRIVRERLDAAEVKTLVGSVDAVVSGRMHLAIAALGQRVPAAGITYQGKFEGLYEHFGLEKMSLSPSELMDGALTDFTRSLLARRGDLAHRIAEQLPGVLDRSMVSFTNLIQPDKVEE